VKSEKEYIEFISGLRDTIYRLARSIITDDAEAEDIAQDVFERVWRTRDTVLSSSYPRAYVCRMTHNLAIDRQRAKQRSQSLALDERTAGNNGDSDTNTKDMAELTRRLIQQLPERQRLIIHMRDVEGYELDEIANILDSDEANVRVNLSRARKSIREELIKMMNYGVR
jgi:RNA polymerase sigma-70 factor (ECF subfamily)